MKNENELNEFVAQIAYLANKKKLRKQILEQGELLFPPGLFDDEEITTHVSVKEDDNILLPTTPNIYNHRNDDDDNILLPICSCSPKKQ